MKNIIILLLLALSFTLEAQVAGWFTNSDSAGTGEPATFYDQLMIGSNGETIRVKTGSADPSSSATLGEIGDLYISSNGKTYQKQDAGSTTNWSVFIPGGATHTYVPFGDVDGTFAEDSNFTYASSSQHLTIPYVDITADGALGNLALEIGGATDAGFFTTGAGANLAVVNNGGLSMLFQGASIRHYKQFQSQAATSSAPSYSFNGMPDGGLYFDSGTDSLRLAVNSVDIQGWDDGTSVFFMPIEYTSGSAPADPNTGNIVTFVSSSATDHLKYKDSNGVARSLDHEVDRLMLTNGSFEQSYSGSPASGWTVSGSATASLELTDIVSSEGNQAVELAQTGVFEMYQTFDCSEYKSGMPLGVVGYVSASPSAELEFCGYDGTNDLNCTSLYTSTSSSQVLEFQKVLAESIGGGTCGIKIKSDAAVTETIHLDGFKFTDSPFIFRDFDGESQMLFLSQVSGFGSTATKSPYFANTYANVNDNTCFSWESDSTNGTTITMLKDCDVDIQYSVHSNANAVQHGIALNPSSVTNALSLLGQSERLAHGYARGSNPYETDSISTSYKAVAGDVLKPYNESNTSTTSTGEWNFTVKATPRTKHVVFPVDNNLTEWEDVSGGISINTGTKGTTDVDEMRCRRVGDSMEVEFSYSQTVAGSAGSGAYLFSIPTTCAGESGLTIDSSKVTFYTTSEGSGAYSYKGTRLGETSVLVSGSNHDGEAIAYDSTRFRIFVTYSTTSFEVSSTDASLANTTVQYSGRLTIPITQWDTEAKPLVAIPTVEPTCYVRPHATDYSTAAGSSASYKTIPAVALEGDCTDMGISISSNVITLPAGDYDIEIPVGAWDEVNWVSAQIYSNTDSATLKECLYVAYNSVINSSANVISWSECHARISLDKTHEIEFQSKAQAVITNGERYQVSKITRKLQ